MPANVKIDFYTVEVPGGSRPFERVVMDDAKTDDDETRNCTIGTCPVRLQRALQDDRVGVVEGDALRIQMEDIPPKAKLAGKVSNIPLASDEGIAGETAFLYQPFTKVLAIQRNRIGVSAKSLAHYFTTKAHLGTPITLAPVIQQDAMRRLVRMKETRKLRVRFAGITNATFFRDNDKSLNDMIDVIEEFKAPSATFELSMGHQPGTLSVQRVVAFVRKAVNLHSDGSGGVSTIEVSGVLDDDTRDVFDLLSYRMVEVVAVQETKTTRRSPYANRRNELRQAWERRRTELEAMFGV